MLYTFLNVIYYLVFITLVFYFGFRFGAMQRKHELHLKFSDVGWKVFQKAVHIHHGNEGAAIMSALQTYTDLHESSSDGVRIEFHTMDESLSWEPQVVVDSIKPKRKGLFSFFQRDNVIFIDPHKMPEAIVEGDDEE